MTDRSAGGDIAELEAIFHPGAVAIVGASANPDSQGFEYVRCFREHCFRGPVYPINPNLDEVLGLKAYPSLRDVPGPVDYVVCCIPAAGVLGLVEDCRRKGVRALHLFTGRFSETGRREAALLEEELKRRAAAAGLRVIGPNCMGLYVPSEGISFRADFPKEPGPVGFLSQSGGNAVELVYHGSVRGLRFSKVISYGNALDLNEADFLEYFTQDQETEVIAAYIEGVVDGPRFRTSLGEAARRKPVVVLKGGRTGPGTRAAASHTAALAGVQQVWSAVVRQAGALEVSSMEELADMLVGLVFMRPGAGRRVGVVGGGGGRTVQGADLCEEAGLQVVPLPPEIREAVRQAVPELGDWVGNPVDQSILGGFPLSGMDILGMMSESPEFDVLIANLGEDWLLGRHGGPELLQHVAERFVEVGRGTSKPLALVLAPPDSPEEWRWRAVTEAQRRLVDGALAVYPSVARAAATLRRLVDYWEERGERRDTS